MNLPRPNIQDRTLAIILGLVFLFSLWFATRGWDRPLLDRHEFRQIQTAVSAYWIKDAGYKFDYETPIFGPPWTIPMEFPVYQAIVGKLAHWVGSDLELTGRIVNLLALLASLPPVYALAGLLGLAPSRRLLVVAAVFSAPVHVFYARTFLIESTALCFSLWFVLAVTRSAQFPASRWPLLAILFGTLAGLAKVTTFLIYLPPALLAAWMLPRVRGEGFLRGFRLLVSLAIPIGIALAVSVAWVRHSDQLKHSNPFAGFLTSTELAKWNWGTLEQRLSGRFWLEFWRNLSSFILSEIALVPLCVGLAIAAPVLRRAALFAVACFLGGTLLFSNLFLHHDYYYFSNATLLLFGAGVLLAAIWDDASLPRSARVTLLAAFFGAQLLIFHRGYGDYLRRTPVTPPGIADVIRATTPADGVIVVYGWDWNAVVPYYAQRRAIMVPDGREKETRVLDDILAQLPPRRVAGVVVATNTLRTSSAFLRERSDRFALTRAPIATSELGDFYLVEDLAAAAQAKVAGQAFAGVTLNLAATSELPFPADKPVDAAKLALSIFTPTPHAARTLFGMEVSEVDGRPVLHAHAPSEVEFLPPAGARAIQATFGLPDAAWNSGPAVTDGIGVEIYERLPNGQHRSLFRRTLDPAHNASDRGPQTAQLDAAGPFTGALIFRFTTGPKDNTTNDWAYWSHIEIR